MGNSPKDVEINVIGITEQRYDMGKKIPHTGYINFGKIYVSPDAKEMIKNWDKKVGYHIGKINKGTYGEISKIQEELDELRDATQNQHCKIMALVELSDIIGAIEGYLSKYHMDTKLEDLITMARITRRAFEAGERK